MAERAAAQSKAGPAATGTGQTAAAPPAAKPAQKLWKIEMPTEVPLQSGWCRCVEDCYTIVKQIGEGTYGQVYLAKANDTGKLVALKKIRMDTEKEGFPITAMREMRLLTRLQHDNVIGLLEVVRSRPKKSNQERGSIYMVFDYMDHDLTGLMERRNYKFTPSHAKCYMKQILNGLNFCHAQWVLHRDLKAANLLINNHGVLKLADFGLARPYSERAGKRGGTSDAGKDEPGDKYTARVITLWYRPPELILGQDRYGPEVDMWSVGCIFAELLMGKALFPGKDDPDQIDRITKLCGSITEDTTPGCKRLPHINYVKPGRPNKLRTHLEEAKLVPQAVDLLCSLLHLDPSKRMLTREAYGHTYFYTPPYPAKPEEMPTFEASHEMDMKQKRSRGKEQGPHAPHPENGHDAKRQRVAAPHPTHGAMRPPPAQAPHPAHSRQPPQQYPGYGPPQGSMPPPAHPPQRPSRPPDQYGGGYGGQYQQSHPGYPPGGSHPGAYPPQYSDRPPAQYGDRSDPQGYHGQHSQYPPPQGSMYQAAPPGGSYGVPGRGYGQHYPGGMDSSRGPPPRGWGQQQQQQQQHYPPDARRGDERARGEYSREHH